MKIEHDIPEMTTFMCKRSYLTDKEITYLAGVSRSTIYRWHRGGATINVIDAILRVLGYRLAIVPLRIE